MVANSRSFFGNFLYEASTA